jgi:hypothetical protein
MNHIKRLWEYYVALTILIIILAFPIYWIYYFAQKSFGKEIALLTLTITIIAVVIFGVRGAVHTHRLIRDLRQDVKDRKHPMTAPNAKIPLIFKILKIEHYHSQAPLTENEIDAGKSEVAPFHFSFTPHPRRGKQSRFPEDKIRKAVLKWESRDPSFVSRTLEEFLAQEFGSGADGILLMAPTTFYDWRRRILKEMEVHEDKS